VKRDGLAERCIDGAIGLQVGSGHVSKAEANHACGGLSESNRVTYCRGAVSRYLRGRERVEKSA
jgi:hypothetical protein